MRPVCPNCHAMIHRQTPLLSIEEVQSLLQKSGFYQAD
jgi:predicted HNH restriction endonuclease